jgi:hypothetical protein
MLMRLTWTLTCCSACLRPLTWIYILFLCERREMEPRIPSYSSVSRLQFDAACLGAYVATQLGLYLLYWSYTSDIKVETLISKLRLWYQRVLYWSSIILYSSWEFDLQYRPSIFNIKSFKEIWYSVKTFNTEYLRYRVRYIHDQYLYIEGLWLQYGVSSI